MKYFAHDRIVTRFGTISKGEHTGEAYCITATKTGDYELFVNGELYAFASNLDTVLDELYFLENDMR